MLVLHSDASCQGNVSLGWEEKGWEESATTVIKTVYRGGKGRAGAALRRVKGCKSPQMASKQIAVWCSNLQNLEASF